MKKVLLAATVVAAMFTSCNCGGQIAEVSKLSTLKDSVSYAYGAFFGENVKSMFGENSKDVDINVLAAGMKAAIEGEAITSQEDINAILQTYFTVTKPEQDRKEESDYLAKVMSSNKNAVTTESGLIYEIIEEGDKSNMPTAVDTVMVLYTGKFASGEIFDSTEQRGNEPATFPLEGLIPGFQEAIQLIGKGGKINMWLPADLAYGEKLMMFENVEIIDVKKKK